jgi:hypothetical protein
MSDLKFTINQIASTHTETVGGTNYLVAPVIAIKAGELNGEQVPADEIGAHFHAWNGRPFVIDHPEQDGEHVSANDPEILAQTQIGKFFNVKMDDGKLKGEIWIDTALAKKIRRGQEVVDRLKRGKQLEVSTAYFRDLDGNTARNLRPDHLAALLDELGACSWEDGCGAPRVNCNRCTKNREVTMLGKNALSTARVPSFDGTETTPWADVDRTFGAFRDSFYRHTDAERPDEPPEQVAGAPQAMKDWIAARTLIGDPSADTEADLIAFPVVNPGTGALSAGGVRAAIARAPQAEISEVTAASIQSVGRDLLESEFDEESEQAAQNSSFLKRVYDTATSAVASALRNHQERKMKDELMQAILNDERLELNQEEQGELGKLSERVLSAIAGALAGQETEDVEPEAQQDDGTAEPEAISEPEPTSKPEPDPEPAQATNAALCPKTATLIEAIEKRGGVESVMGLLDNLAANRDERRNELVTALVANEQCQLGAGDLRAMSTEMLQKLNRSFIKPDYSGQGGEPRADKATYSVKVNTRIPVKEQ